MVLARKFLFVKFYRIGAGFSNAGIIVIAKISEFLLFVNVIVTISEVFSFCFIMKMLAVDEREVSISRELHHLTNFTNWNFSFNFSGLSPIIRFLSHCLFNFSFFPDYKRLPILREHLLWCDEPYFSVFKPISLPANVPAALKPIKFT